MLLTALSLANLATAALSLAVPQTTGPSGGQPPYATSTNITFYQGVSASSGSIFTSSPSSHANDCGIWVASDVIEANVCRKFTTQGVGIWGSKNGSCSLTLFKGSDSCGEDAEKSVFVVEDGEENVTCVATGVMDGGLHYKGSGVWGCG